MTAKATKTSGPTSNGENSARDQGDSLPEP